MSEETKIKGATYIWETGSIVRACRCGTDTWPPSPCLKVLTDGRMEWATCPTCGKSWNMKSLNEIKSPNDKTTSGFPVL